MTDVFGTYFFRYKKNDPIHCRLFQLTLNSFRYHNQSAEIVVHTNAPDLIPAHIGSEVLELEAPPTSPWHYSLDFWRTCSKLCYSSDRIIATDMDMLFLSDPFEDNPQCPFRRVNDAKPVGFSTRMYPYKYPTTVSFVAMIPNTLCQYYFGSKLEQWMKTPNIRYDENVLDMEYALHLFETETIVDLGWYWDYCPGIEAMKRELYYKMYIRAAETRSVGAIHFKGDTKLLIFEKEFQKLPENQWNS